MNKDDELRAQAVEDFIILMEKNKLPDILAQVLNDLNDVLSSPFDETQCRRWLGS